MQVSALQYPEFRRYFVGQSVSVVGTWMQSVAAAWLVLQLSHDSAVALALFGACSYGPVLLFGLYAGTIVDRFPHRDVLLITQIASLVGAATAAAVSSGVMEWPGGRGGVGSDMAGIIAHASFVE